MYMVGGSERNGNRCKFESNMVGLEYMRIQLNQIIHTPIITPRTLSPPPPHIVFIKSETSSSSVKLIQKTITTTTTCTRPRRGIIASFFAALAAAVVAGGGTPAGAAEPRQQYLEDAQTLSNIPQTLSGTDCKSPSPKDCKRPKIQRPKSRKAESCTIKCVTTCIRGGDGSPGEGPLNITRPLVVFKQGFRSRQYCLVECSDICNLIPDDSSVSP